MKSRKWKITITKREILISLNCHSTQTNVINHKKLFYTITCCNLSIFAGKEIEKQFKITTRGIFFNGATVLCTQRAVPGGVKQAHPWGQAANCLSLQWRYWVGQKFHLVCSIRQKIHFSFSPITLLIWIFSVCHLSLTWYNINRLQLMSWFNFSWTTQLWSIIQREISDMKLHKTLLMCSINHSTFSVHSLHKSFFAFHLHFYLSWNNKA